jgi:hypothetical protein
MLLISPVLWIDAPLIHWTGVNNNSFDAHFGVFNNSFGASIRLTGEFHNERNTSLRRCSIYVVPARLSDYALLTVAEGTRHSISFT